MINLLTDRQFFLLYKFAYEQSDFLTMCFTEVVEEIKIKAKY